jgi:hypothetical protein
MYVYVFPEWYVSDSMYEDLNDQFMYQFPKWLVYENQNQFVFPEWSMHENMNDQFMYPGMNLMKTWKLNWMYQCSFRTGWKIENLKEGILETEWTKRRYSWNMKEGIPDTEWTK